MKSKSLISLVEHQQQQQVYPTQSLITSTSKLNAEPTAVVDESEKENKKSIQIKQPQQSSTKHRIYHLSEEKINDFIFIEERAPRIKVFNNNSKYMNILFISPILFTYRIYM